MRLLTILNLLSFSLLAVSLPHSIPRDATESSLENGDILDPNLYARGCAQSSQKDCREGTELPSRPAAPQQNVAPLEEGPSDEEDMSAVLQTKPKFGEPGGYTPHAMFNKGKHLKEEQDLPGLYPKTGKNGQPLDPVFVPDSNRATKGFITDSSKAKGKGKEKAPKL